MALSQQEFDKLKARLGGDTTVGKPVTTPSTPNYIERVGQQYKTVGEDIVKGVKEIDAGAKQNKFLDTLKNIGRTALRTVGGVASATFAPITEAPVVKPALEVAGEGISKVLPQGVSDFAQKYPEAFKDLMNIVDIGTFGVGKIAEKPLQTAIEKGVKTGVDIAESVIRPVADIAGTGFDTAKLAVEGSMRVPERIATNVAERKAIQESIKTLPNKVSQRAVQDGVDIRDVQTLLSVPKEQKQVVSKLVKNVQDFETGKTKVDPMETVGKPFVDRMKVLQKKQSEVGKQLGDVANTLTVVVPEDKLANNVFTSLKNTRGLEGLRFADDGTLDFTDTVLATAETAGDRSAIQSIFTDAVKSGTGKQKHLLRQELRESLGGKKRGGVQLTGTQEQAYEAIRKGLSNTLDEINPAYKRVNTEYAKVSQPLNELTKILKATGEIDDDILNLSGGILARRLTSAGIGNANVRKVLQAVDNATKVKGKTLASVETLQDVMNVLNRYYDIAPRTGYQKLTEEGVSRGVGDFISNTVGSVAGRTDAVRKKALEDLLNNLLIK